jgi:hypothetical protein
MKQRVSPPVVEHVRARWLLADLPCWLLVDPSLTTLTVVWP